MGISFSVRSEFQESLENRLKRLRAKRPTPARS